MFAVFESHPTDLESHLNEFEGLLDPEASQRLMVSILDGLTFLDLQDIEHWDIKPNNVLVSACGLCVLADLGESLTKLPKDRMFVLHRDLQAGNRVYRAPEVLNAMLPFVSVATTVPMDLSGQASFEAGMLFGFMILRRLPLIEYPEAFFKRHDGPAGDKYYKYTRADICVLTEDEQRALETAGYSLDVIALICDMLDPDKGRRPSLAVFRERLLVLLDPSVVNRVRTMVSYCWMISL